MLPENYSLYEFLTFFHQSTTKEWAIYSIIVPATYPVTNSYPNICHKARIFTHSIDIFRYTICVTDKYKLIIDLVKTSTGLILIKKMCGSLRSIFIWSLRLYILYLLCSQVLRYASIAIINTKFWAHRVSHIKGSFINSIDHLTCPLDVILEQVIHQRLTLRARWTARIFWNVRENLCIWIKIFDFVT